MVTSKYGKNSEMKETKKHETPETIQYLARNFFDFLDMIRTGSVIIATIMKIEKS